ncbi:MAG: SGNH/GDSL hydrolase family protein [Candidatus Omnitrophota bacterium]
MKIKKTILLVFFIFITLFLAEIGFRLLVKFDIVDYPKPDFEKIIHKYSAIKGLIYELKASSSSEDGLIRTNKFGIRDIEYTLAKPKDTTRICVIGDSVAFGYGENHPLLALEKIFSEILEKRLNENSEHKYEVLNFSVIGYNAFQEQIVLKEKVMKFSPDFVIIAYVPNDDTYTGGLGELAREMAPHSLGPVLHSKLVSYVLYRWERKNFYNMSNMNMIWDLFRTIQALKANEKFEAIILMTSENNDLNHWDSKHELVKKNAISSGLAVIDLREKWRSLNPEYRETLYLPGEIHYTERGMQETADALVSFFKEKKGRTLF